MTAAPMNGKFDYRCLMIVFAVYFALNYQQKEPFYVYAGICIALLAAATSAELSGATLTIAYTIESAVIAE